MSVNDSKSLSSATLSLVSPITDSQESLSASREIEQLKRLLEVSARIHSIDDSRLAIRIIVDAALELVDAHSGGSGLLENDKIEFTLGNANGHWQDLPLRFLKGESLSGHTWLTNQPIISNKPLIDPIVNRKLYKALGCYNAVAVPIMSADGRYLGCLEIHNTKHKGGFSSHDVWLLQRLAAWASVALKNNQILDEQQAAITLLSQISDRHDQLFHDHLEAKLLLEPTTGRIIEANHAALKLYGFDTLAGMTISELEAEPSALTELQKLPELIIKGSKEIPALHRSQNEGNKVVSVGLGRVVNASRDLLVANVRDITKQMDAEAALAESQHMTRIILENVCESVVHLDSMGILKFINPAAGQLVDYKQEEVLGLSAFDFIHIEDPDDFTCAGWIAIKEISSVLAGGDAIRYSQGSITGRDGTRIPVEFRCAATRNHAGELNGCVISFVDIRERLNQEHNIRKLAYSDSLTGLPNRLALQQQLDDLVTYGRETGRVGAMLFWDVDNFKTINDSLGHSIGDEVLKEIANRASQCVDKTDIVARHGGDEFVMMSGQLFDDRDAVIRSARNLATTLQTRLAEPYSIGGHLLHSSVSVGIAIFGGKNGVAGDDVIRQADTAMYEAKRQGRARVCEFELAMHQAVTSRLILEGELRRALKNGELAANYQPKVGVDSQIICGAEVLMRWHHPTRGIIMPDEFIPTAEDTGLMPEFGEVIFDAVFLQLQTWIKAGLKAVPLAINLSASQFTQPHLAQHLGKKLTHYGLPGSLLELEITETTLMTNPEQVRMNMLALRQIGVRISVDDFGTGYSSLNYLKKFPIDAIKIDRTFIDDIPLDPDDRAITSAIISMSKALQLKTIAEGVETEAQLGYLQGLGCDQYQGWLHSKAMPADEFGLLLEAL